ncbi:hypothetical protein ABPG74_013214 [Tetrahymena malaccensis]
MLQKLRNRIFGDENINHNHSQSSSQDSQKDKASPQSNKNSQSQKINNTKGVLEEHTGAANDRLSSKNHPKLKYKHSLKVEDSLDKINIHRVYNKKEDFTPIGQSITNNQYQNHQEQEDQIFTQFGKMLNENIIDYRTLKTKSWKGIPAVYRAVVWKIILDYMPPNRELAEEQMNKMRNEYQSYVQSYFENETVRQNFSKTELNMIKVVDTDVPRTQPLYEIYKAPVIQNMLKRILVVWGLRHPACGYVQGINEIATPFILVFLSQYIQLDSKLNYPIPEGLDNISEQVMQEIEADTYWCMAKILDKIQDNYTNGQPGIKRSLDKIGQIVQKIDPALANHFKNERVEYVQFSFRWILCLLIREFPIQQVFRIFDTYLADDKGFAVLHVYMCAALILKYSKKIQKMKFNDIILFFQNLPTQNWSDEDIEMLLAEAFVYMSLFEQTQGHIKPTVNFSWH